MQRTLKKRQRWSHTELEGCHQTNLGASPSSTSYLCHLVALDSSLALLSPCVPICKTKLRAPREVTVRN